MKSAFSDMQSITRVIATDEAGYGPKLGPLVIGATGYRVETDAPNKCVDRFACLHQKYAIGDAVVRVGDSKTIFKSKSVANADRDPLANLHATVSVANSWCDHSEPEFASWLQRVACEDWASIKQCPWLAEVTPIAFLNCMDVSQVAESWSKTGVSLDDVRCRVITAAKFNEACSAGLNKADLLSESTLGLVRDFLQTPTDASETRVFCDRHGGRRYYASVLQHVLRDADVVVVRESKVQSVYRVNFRGHVSQIHFTVKGDSFAPVALSSIYAKYIRERSMGSFNRYFAKLHKEASTLKPTAGYPVDANRFLTDIAPIIHREKIPDAELIRVR